jgi:hypothetical protein
LIKYPVAAGSRRPSGHRAGLRCRHRSVNRCLEGQRGDRTDTRYGHKSADLRIMTRQPHNLAVKFTDLLPDGIARFEQRSDCSYQLRAALDQLLGSHGEDIELGR